MFLLKSLINYFKKDENNWSASPIERKQTSIECKKFKEIKQKDQGVFWEMLEILLENYKELWKNYKESSEFIFNVLQVTYFMIKIYNKKTKEVNDKYINQLNKLQESLEAFELKYNINGI